MSIFFNKLEFTQSNSLESIDEKDIYLINDNRDLAYVKNGRIYRLVEESPDGDLSVNNDLSVGNDLDISNDARIDGALDVIRDATLRRGLTVSETSEFNGDVYINANLIISKDFQLGQDGTISGDLKVGDSLTVNDLSVDGSATMAVLTVSSTISDTDGNIRDDINDAFIAAYTTQYGEVTYNSDKYKTQIDVWDTSAKATKLFTKTYTYNSDNYMTASVLTDEINTKTLTKAWTYDSDNYVISFTKAYT